MPNEDNEFTYISEDGEVVERKHDLARCEQCPWRKHPYAGEKGPEDADVLVIGEAPGAQEVAEGVPFVGPSGQLLDKVLAHHRLDRSEIRFTNVVACHPSFVRGSAPTPPPKEAIRACSPRLRSELEGRDAVLLLGNTAKEAVLGTREPITRVRQGPPRSLVDYPNTKFIASIHPAACLRHSDSFPSLVRDVSKLKGDIYVKWEEPKFAVFDDANTSSAALRSLLESSRAGCPITVDIEVGAEKDTSFTHPNELLCVGIGYRPNRAFVLGETALQDKGVQATLGQVLNTREVICHNGKFDLQVLMRLGLIDEPRLYADTMLASYVLDERPGNHGLKGLASEILGAPNYASALDRYVGKGDSYALIPRPVLYKYNAYDAALTFNLWEHFEGRLKRDNLRHVHDRLIAISQELIHIELDGVSVDQPYLDVLTEEFTAELDLLEQEMQELVQWRSFNPRSPQQVMRVLEAARYHVGSTDVETLTALYHRAPVGSQRRRFLELMLQHRKTQKSYGTYVKGTRKRLINGRVYPTYLVHGTVSGRLSCRNPNLQNVTRGDKLRRMFVAEEGWSFLQADYKQAELRVMATEGRDEYLRDAFSDPQRDFLSEITERFYGPNWTSEQRVRGKAAVYGVSYGREAPSIAAEHGITSQEAQQFIDLYFQMASGVAKWRRGIIDQVLGTKEKSGQALQTHFGRKRRFWLITRQNRVDVEKEALSFVPQSTANDICLSALVRLRRSFGSGTSAPRLRIPVHDSLLVGHLEADRVEVQHTIREVMEQTAREEYTDFVPFPVDIKVGTNWGEISG